ncbi:MAG: hypothetical protein IKQ16_02415 [Lentisphaeria bacterium]|nr:hypothetical protein [Lentisphaeria bacterium]
MKLQIKVESSNDLQELASSVSSEEFVELWAEAVMRLAKKNAEREAGTGFGRRVVAEGVRAETFPGRAEVTADYIGEHVHTGGPIASRNGKDLAIPLDTPASRQFNPQRLFARELNAIRLFPVKTKRGKKLLFRVPEKGEKNAKQEGPLFVVLHQTRPQRARPWWPTQEEAESASEKLLKSYLAY